MTCSKPHLQNLKAPLDFVSMIARTTTLAAAAPKHVALGTVALACLL